MFYHLRFKSLDFEASIEYKKSFDRRFSSIVTNVSGHHVSEGYLSPLVISLGSWSRSKILGQILANVSGEHEAKGGIALNFIVDGLPKTLTLVPPLSTSCSPVTISILERSENFGQILANVSGEHPKRNKGMPWISSSKADFRRPCASTSNSSPPYDSPSPKTWNRVQSQFWSQKILANESTLSKGGCRFSSKAFRKRCASPIFPDSLPISQSPWYSRVFFTPYESTRDVKPRPKSTMKVPFDCRFSSIVADFSVHPV